MATRLNNQISDKLLSAAEKLVTERGAEGMSLGDVAACCDISKGTLYYYFKTRDELLTALAERCTAAMEERLFAWMNGLTAVTSAQEAAKSLAAVFFSEGSPLTTYRELISCFSDEAKAVCTSAAEAWRIVLEIASLRLGQAGESLAARSALVVPLAVGLSASGAEDQEKALITLLAE